MKNVYLIFLGIDLIKPVDEKNVKIVYSIKKTINNDDYLILSLEKNKDKKINGKNVLVIKKNMAGKLGQFLKIIINLMLIRIKQINKKVYLNVIWSGFGIVDFFILLLSRFLFFNTTYSILNIKQTEYPFLNLANKIIVFSPDLKKLIGLKNKNCFFIAPILLTKKYERNQRHKLFLFTTIPIYKKNFNKRGVYRLFEFAKYVKNKDPKIKFLVLNRWIEGSKILKKIKFDFGATNVQILNKSVKNIEKYYSESEALINLDLGSEIPQFSLSIAEAIMCNCPVISISKTWLTMLIDKFGAGMISSEKNKDLYHSILKIHNNIKKFENNCQILTDELSFNNFEKEYLDILKK